MPIRVVNSGGGTALLPSKCAYCGKPRHRGVCKERYDAQKAKGQPIPVGRKPKSKSQSSSETAKPLMAEDGTPATAMVPFEAPRLTGRPNKEINLTYLRLSGHFMHADHEAAAFQNMTPAQFSNKMKAREPGSGLTYREIFDQARASGQATLKRRVWEYIDLKNSAGATILKFALQNELGWTERSTQEGRVDHRHAHLHRQAPEPPKDLAGLTNEQLAEFAMGSPGKGRPN